VSCRAHDGAERPLNHGVRQGAEGGLVSAVIPAWNVERYVAAAIQSVLDQDYPRVEIIVVDDGSADATVARVEEFVSRGAPVSLLRQPHGGACRARNHGLAAARGEFVQFLDADDWLAPQKFSAQVRWLREHPEIAMAWSDHIVVAERGDPIRTVTLDLPSDRRGFMRAMLGGEGCPHTNSLLLRTRPLRERGVRWDETLGAAQEWDFQLQAVRAGIRPGRCVGQFSYYRRRTSGNIWSRTVAEVTRHQEWALDKWAGLLGTSPDLRRAAARSYFKLARRYRQAGRPDDAERLLREVFRLDPGFAPNEDNPLFNLIARLTNVRVALWAAGVKRRLGA